MLTGPIDGTAERRMATSGDDVDERLGIQSVEVATAILTAMAQFTGQRR